MTLPRLTASSLELASTCPGSFAHEPVSTTTEAAERGTAIHEYIAALLDEEECRLPADDSAAQVCRRLDGRRLRDTASLDPYSKRHTEIALYLCPSSGHSGVLQGDYHRDYSGAPNEVGALTGTVGAVAVEDVRVRVTNWKIGNQLVPDPAENHQLRFLGLAAARVFGRDQTTLQIASIRTDGSIDVRSATFEKEDLADIEAGLARIVGRVERAGAGEPVYRPGSHCRSCPALAHCPALSGVARRSRGKQWWPSSKPAAAVRTVRLSRN